MVLGTSKEIQSYHTRALTFTSSDMVDQFIFPHPASKMSKKTIKFALIIDNNNDNFNCEKLLHDIGVPNILKLTSTTDALIFLQQAKKDIPQIILIDLFPIMNVLEFLDKFHERFSKQPIDIFILAASSNPPKMQRAIVKKCAGFIEKPLTSEKLREQIIGLK